MIVEKKILLSLLIAAMAAEARSDSITSDFASGADGWRAVDINIPNYSSAAATYAVAYSNSGGNPDGFIALADPSGSTFYFDAPAKFLGNQNASYGQSLSWDIRSIFAVGTVLNLAPADLVLSGGGITLVYDAPFAPTPGSWTSFNVILNESGWKNGSLLGANATASDMHAVLSSLSSLRILGEYGDGTDTGNLDNIALGSNAAPLPATATGGALMLGAFGMSRCYGRARKQ
jgi:Laminin B (Domain IV)